MKKNSTSNVIKFAGAYIAYIIGSGFATGQEIIQFYTSYGWVSIIGILISMFLFAWVGRTVMVNGFHHKSEKSGNEYQTYCGKYLGKFYEVFVPFFLFCVVVIMISGAGATLNEYYGLNYYVGSLLMAVLIYAAYVFGLKGVVNVIGFIGPVIIVFTLGVGLFTLFKNGLNLVPDAAAQAQLAESQASGHWLVSGVLYAAYNVFGAIIFLTALGKEADSKKEAARGGMLGGIVLMGATLIMNIAFLSKLGDVANLAIPTLYLADTISPLIGKLFSVVLICGIFSTAAPMTWTVCNKITAEGTKKSKLVAAVIVVAAFFCGQLPFGTLVGIIYPYTGYLGILFMICLAGHEIKNRIRLKKVPVEQGGVIAAEPEAAEV